MSVYPHKKWPGWWTIDYLPNGKRKDPVTGKIKRDRINYKGTEAMALLREAQLRQTPGTQLITSSTIEGTYARRYVWYLNNKSKGTAADFSVAWVHLKPAFGLIKWSQLTPHLIEQYKGVRIADGVKKRTIHRELSYLRSWWKWSAENEYCPDPHFNIKGFDKGSIAPPPKDVPDIQEVQDIIDNAHPDRRILLMLFYYCGLRRTEACTVKRHKVYLKKGLIEITGKGNKTDVVPIPDKPDFIEELTKTIKVFNGTEFLVVNPRTKKPYKDIRGTIKEAAKRAGFFGKIHPHLFRHAYTTHEVESGMNPKVIQENSRHEDFKTTQGYIHTVAKFRKEETKKFSEYLNKNVSPGDKFVPKNHRKNK